MDERFAVGSLYDDPLVDLDALRNVVHVGFANGRQQFVERPRFGLDLWRHRVAEADAGGIHNFANFHLAIVRIGQFVVDHFDFFRFRLFMSNLRIDRRLVKRDVFFDRHLSQIHQQPDVQNHAADCSGNAAAAVTGGLVVVGDFKLNDLFDFDSLGLKIESRCELESLGLGRGFRDFFNGIGGGTTHPGRTLHGHRRRHFLRIDGGAVCVVVRSQAHALSPSRLTVGFVDGTLFQLNGSVIGDLVTSYQFTRRNVRLRSQKRAG